MQMSRSYRSVWGVFNLTQVYILLLDALDFRLSLYLSLSPAK